MLLNHLGTQFIPSSFITQDKQDVSEDFIQKKIYLKALFHTRSLCSLEASAFAKAMAGQAVVTEVLYILRLSGDVDKRKPPFPSATGKKSVNMSLYQVIS
jgi:hypothetical protein